MAFIDGSVVNVALPAIQADLDASVAGAQWVVNAYMLMLGALILVGGAAGDRSAGGACSRSGVALFTAASVACGLAPSLPVADRRARAAGHRRRAAGAEQPRHHQRGLPRRRARPGDRHLGRLLGAHDRARARCSAAGWSTCWSWRADLPRQRADRRGHARASPLARAGEPRRAGARRSTGAAALLATLGLGAVVVRPDRGRPTSAGRIRRCSASLLGGVAAPRRYSSGIEARAAAPMMPLDLFRSRDLQRRQRA